jgi:O-methyltransferase
LELLSESNLKEILEIAAPLSMVHETGLRFAAEQAVRAVENDLLGDIVECGVWRGGASIAMLLAQRIAFGAVVKPVHMFDSFKGLPPVDPQDGPLAAAWQAGADPKNYFENCRAARSDLDFALAHLSFSSNDFVVWEGAFEEIMVAAVKAIGLKGVALLRLDSDWYRSTKLCLESLIPITTEGAVVIVDDYYAWDGCARAVHEYLSTQSLPYRIKSLPHNFGAYFLKRKCRKSFDEF